MRPHIREEIEVIEYNTNVVVEKLQSGTLSTVGAIAARELIKTLTKVKNFISDEKSMRGRVDLIVSELHVLYFQIPKIN